MSQEEHETTLEEAFYYQTLNDVAELIHLYGTKQVFKDLKRLISEPINKQDYEEAISTIVN